MALIPCPDCGANVSEKAPACIQCGHPMDEDESDAHKAARNRIRTIERTGKDAKLLKLISILMIIIGIAMVFIDSIAAHTKIAVWCLLLGIPLNVIARIVAWWKYR